MIEKSKFCDLYGGLIAPSLTFESDLLSNNKIASFVFKWRENSLFSFYYHKIMSLQVEVARAKKQLQSMLMMNLESRIIVFEDIGRYSKAYSVKGF